MALAVPMSKMTATHGTNVFLYHQIVPSGISIFLLADSDSQFVSSVFAAIYRLRRLTHLSTTAYHAQEKEKVERCNKMTIARLQN